MLGQTQIKAGGDTTFSRIPQETGKVNVLAKILSSGLILISTEDYANNNCVDVDFDFFLPLSENDNGKHSGVLQLLATCGILEITAIDLHRLYKIPLMIFKTIPK